MSENDLENLNEVKPRRFQPGWFVPVFLHPRKAMAELADQNHPVWIAPLLFLMVSALVLVLVAAPILSNVPVDYSQPEMDMYYTPEQMESLDNAATMQVSPLITVVFPLLGRIAGVWISWFLLGGILHLALTLNGSRSSSTSALNTVSWASLPFLARDLVQIAAVLITRQLITKPGLSGFAVEGAAGLSAYWGAFLAFIDVYLIWQVVLIGIGAGKISGLKSGKVWMVTLVAVLLFLALKSLPGFLGSQLGALASSGAGF